MKKLISLLLVIVLICAMAPAALAADQNQDYAAYYLTKYNVQAGDTLFAVCDTRGLNYAEYLTVIKNVNGIANENNLIAGRDYWIPAKTLGKATEYYTVYRHVLVAGDTVSALCAKYNIGLNASEAMLKAVNNVTSLSNFMAGTTILIPVPAGTPAPAGTTAAPATTTTTTTTTTPTAGTTPAPAGVPTGATAAVAPAAVAAAANLKDGAVYYLTPYQVAVGDTIGGICAARGLNFADYLDVIQNVNKMASVNQLIAGLTYWMPSAGIGGAASYYTIYRHTLVAGDTVYGLCLNYGIDLAAYSDLIQKLNGVNTLTGFMVGQKILLPIFTENAANPNPAAAGTVTPDAAAAGQTTGTAVTTTVTNPDGTTTTTTTTTVTTTPEAPGLFDANTADTYYLVPYVVKGGDSLISICNGLGSSFDKNKGLIATANGLTTYALHVGQTIYIPASSNAGYTKYYSVSNHSMAAGETVFALCTGAGGDFNASYKMLTALNAGVNLNWLTVGQKIVIPVFHG